MRRFFPLLAVALATFSGGLAYGQGTRLWSQSTFEALERGKPNGVAITSDGHLTAGPSSTLIATTPSTYVWSVAADKTGNAYLATGSPAGVLRVAPDGKTTKIFSAKDLNVQLVRVGPDGAIYAATLPSGKVYKLDAKAADLNEDNATVVFDPAATAEKPKYVWDIAFDSEGRLYVAAGGPAGIYRIESGSKPGGKPELFFKSDEQHIRALAFDTAGNLIAGSDGTGLVYRIDKNGKGYVIFDASKREITSVAVGANGAIYAAAVGEKGRETLPPMPITGNAAVTVKIIQPGSVGAFSANSLIPDGSEIDEIAANGAPRKLWTGREDIVYALRWTKDGLLAATGNRGRIYRIAEDGSYADVAHLEASQVTGFADSERGTFVGTANTGKVYLLSHGDAAEGTYLSDVFDAGVFSQWGRAEVETGPGSGSFDFYARAGNIDNPERGWSEWRKVAPNAEPLGIDAARFVQWKTVLHPGAEIASVGIDYLPVNVAPVVEEIVVEPGARVNPNPMEATQAQQVAINFPASQTAGVINFAQEPGHEPLVGLRDKSAVTARWIAHDENGDALEFAVYYRGEGERNWQLLKKNIRQTYLSFDAELLPDGPYRLKVVASDAPSHNPGEALTGERVSNRFVIDTTPPVVNGIMAHLAEGKIHVELSAADATTPISHAEYSVDAGPWQYIEPVGKISDSLTEKFSFDAPLRRLSPDAPAPVDASEHVITVRVFDRNDNAVAVKAVVR